MKQNRKACQSPTISQIYSKYSKLSSLESFPTIKKALSKISSFEKVLKGKISTIRLRQWVLNVCLCYTIVVSGPTVTPSSNYLIFFISNVPFIFKNWRKIKPHERWSLKLNISEEFNILIKGKPSEDYPLLLFPAHTPCCLQNARSSPLTCAGFPGSKSGLIFSFENLSKCLLCVMYIFVCRNLLLLPVWANYCPTYSSTSPYVKHPRLIASPAPSRSHLGIPHLPPLPLYAFLWRDVSVHLSILLEVINSLIAKTIGHASVSVACHNALCTAGAQNTFIIDNWLILLSTSDCNALFLNDFNMTEIIVVAL